MTEYASLIICFFIVALAAVTGSIFPTGPWYESLKRPWFTPPNWLFPIAWTILYVMIAIAGWRVWQPDGLGLPLAFWAMGLVCNAAWSWLMFGRHDIGWALVDLVALWLTIAAFIWLVLPIDRTAAYLFMPYLVWVSYAGLLNFEIWRTNP